MSDLKLHEPLEMVRMEDGFITFEADEGLFVVGVDHERWEHAGRPVMITVTVEKLT